MAVIRIAVLMAVVLVDFISLSLSDCGEVRSIFLCLLRQCANRDLY